MGLKDEVVLASDPNEEGSQTSDLDSLSSEVDQTDTKSNDSQIVESSDAAESNGSEVAGEAESSDSQVVESVEEESEVAEEAVPAVAEEEEEEEDLEDPMDTIREGCQADSHCAKYKEELDRCTERVEGKENTTETCAQELYDFIHCTDHCVSKTLFSQIK